MENKLSDNKTIITGITAIIVVITLLFIFIPKMRATNDEISRDLMNDLNFMEGNINPLTVNCSEVLEYVKQSTFSNSVNKEIRLLSYEDIYLVTQSENLIECMAKALFTTGSEGRFIFYVESKNNESTIGFRQL